MDHHQRNKLFLRVFQAILHDSEDMIFIKDKNLIYLAASDAFARMVGYTYGKALTGKKDIDIFSPELTDKYTKDDQELLKNGGCILNYIEPMPDQEGRKRYCSTSKYIIRDDAGEIIGLYGVAKDVTAEVELKQERESNHLSKQMFDDVLEADLTQDRILCVDGTKWSRGLPIGEFTSFSEAMQIIADRCVHESYREEFIKVFDVLSLIDHFKNEVRELTNIFYFQHALRPYENRWVKCTSRLYFSRVSDTLRITTFLKDVDEEVRSREQLQKEAKTDALTGIYNRASVLKEISECLSSQSEAEENALLFIDLDCFKEANDSWGHMFGDEVLQNIAKRLQEMFRGNDIVGRLGGDEFLVFVRGIKNRASMEKKARQVLETLHTRYEREEREINITCSIGIALCKNSPISVERLCANADMAMYRAKAKGRNQVFFYEDL